MGISISPFTFRYESPQMATPKVRTFEELQQLKKEPTQVAIEGDIYRSSATNFKKLSLKELQHETFVVDTSKHEYITYSDGSVDNTNRIVAIRDPKGTGKVLTFDLSQKTVDALKKKFADDNFFERGDNVLQLNGEAENLVAGWMQNIRQDRNYTKADADGNGRIDGNEAQELTIAFERKGGYDYLGEKLVQINLGMGANYQSLGRSSDAHHLFETEQDKADNKAMGYTYQRSVTSSEYTEFENTVEKELNHTLQMDTNLDGTVTLDEGLQNEFGPNYRQQIIDITQKAHKDLLEAHPDLNDESHLQHHDIGLRQIVSEDEEKTQLEAFRKQVLYVKEQIQIDQIQNAFFLGTSTSLDILDAKYRKTQTDTDITAFASQEGRMNYAAVTTSTSESDADKAKINTYG